MLPTWSPERLTPLMPGAVLATVGARRQGKSVLCADLLEHLFKSEQLDLCFCFVGSACCNPVYKAILNEYSDDRLFFPQFSAAMVNRLCEQQADLAAEGRMRSVMLLVDDVVLCAEDRDLLCNCATRSRHFGMSLLFCSVSWTMLPKICRRSLDILFLLSQVSQGDAYLLSKEFCRSEDGLWALKRLEEHTSLVLEMSSGGSQVLQQYRARHLGQDLRVVKQEIQESPVDDLSQTAPQDLSSSEALQSADRPRTTDEHRSRSVQRGRRTGSAGRSRSPSEDRMSADSSSTHSE